MEFNNKTITNETKPVKLTNKDANTNIAIKKNSDGNMSFYNQGGLSFYENTPVNNNLYITYDALNDTRSYDYIDGEQYPYLKQDNNFLGFDSSMLRDSNAYNQPLGAMALRALGQFVTTFVGDAVTSIGSLALWQNENALTKFGNSISEWGREAMPIYLTEKDEQGGILGSFTWRNLLHGFPTLGSAAASMIPTMGAVRLGRALGGFMKTAKAAKSVKDTTDIIKSINALDKTVKLSGINKYRQSLSKIFTKSTQKEFLRNASYGIGKALESRTGQILTGAVVGAHLDTAIEVAYQMPEWKRYAREELGLSEAEAEIYADEVGSNAYWEGWGYGILFNAISVHGLLSNTAGMNIAGFGKAFSKTLKKSIRTGKKFSDVFEDVYKVTFKKALRRKAWDMTKTFFGEGLEEMRVDIALVEGQYDVNKARGYDNGNLKDTWIERLFDYVSVTRNWDSFIWGGIGGMGITAFRSRFSALAHPKSYVERENKRISEIVSTMDYMIENINKYNGNFDIEPLTETDEKTGETKYAGFDNYADDLLIPLMNKLIETGSIKEGKALVDAVSKLTDAEMTASNWSSNARNNIKMLQREFNRAENAMGIAANRSFKGKYKHAHRATYAKHLYNFGLYNEQLKKVEGKLSQKEIELEEKMNSFRTEVSDKVGNDNMKLQDEIDKINDIIQKYEELEKTYNYQIENTKKIENEINKQLEHVQILDVENEKNLKTLRNGHYTYKEYYKSQLAILRNQENTEGITEEERKRINEERKKLKNEYERNIELEEQLKNKRRVNRDEINRLNAELTINATDANLKKAQLSQLQESKTETKKDIELLNSKRNVLSEENKKKIDYYTKEKKSKHSKALLDTQYAIYQNILDELTEAAMLTKNNMELYENEKSVERLNELYDTLGDEVNKEKKKKAKLEKKEAEETEEDTEDETPSVTPVGNKKTKIKKIKIKTKSKIKTKIEIKNRDKYESPYKNRPIPEETENEYKSKYKNKYTYVISKENADEIRKDLIEKYGFKSEWLIKLNDEEIQKEIKEFLNRVYEDVSNNSILNEYIIYHFEQLENLLEELKIILNPNNNISNEIIQSYLKVSKILNARIATAVIINALDVEVSSLLYNLNISHTIPVNTHIIAEAFVSGSLMLKEEKFYIDDFKKFNQQKRFIDETINMVLNNIMNMEITTITNEIKSDAVIDIYDILNSFINEAVENSQNPDNIKINDIELFEEFEEVKEVEEVEETEENKEENKEKTEENKTEQTDKTEDKPQKLKPNKVYKYKKDDKVTFTTDENGNVEYIEISHGVSERFQKGSVLRLKDGGVIIVKTIKFADNEIYINNTPLTNFIAEFDKTIVNYQFPMELLETIDTEETQQKLIEYLQGVKLEILSDNHISSLRMLLSILLPIRDTKNETLKTLYTDTVKDITNHINTIEIFNYLLFNIDKLNVLSNISLIAEQLNSIAQQLSLSTVIESDGKFQILNSNEFEKRKDVFNHLIHILIYQIDTLKLNNVSYATDNIYRMFSAFFKETIKNSQNIYNARVKSYLKQRAGYLTDDNESVMKLKEFVKLLEAAYAEWVETDKVSIETINQLKAMDIENLFALGIDPVSSGFNLVKETVVPVYQTILAFNDYQQNQQESENIADIVFSIVNFSKDFVENENEENTENVITTKTQPVKNKTTKGKTAKDKTEENKTKENKTEAEKKDYEYYISENDNFILNAVNNLINEINERYKGRLKITFEHILAALYDSLSHESNKSEDYISDKALTLYKVLSKVSSENFLNSLEEVLKIVQANGTEITNIGKFNELKTNIEKNLNGLGKELKHFVDAHNKLDTQKYLDYFFKRQVQQTKWDTHSGLFVVDNVFRELSKSINEETNKLAEKITIDGVEYNTIDILKAYKEIKAGTPVQYTIDKNGDVILSINSSITGTSIRIGTLTAQTKIDELSIESIDENGNKHYNSFLGDELGFNNDLTNFINQVAGNTELFELLRKIYLGYNDAVQAKTSIHILEDFLNDEKNIAIKNNIEKLITVNENEGIQLKPEQVFNRLYTVINSMFRTYTNATLPYLINIDTVRVSNHYRNYNKSVSSNYNLRKTINNKTAQGIKVQFTVSSVTTGSYRYNEDTRELKNIDTAIPEDNKNPQGKIEIIAAMQVVTQNKTFGITNNTDEQIPEIKTKHKSLLGNQIIFYATMYHNGKKQYVPLRNGKVGRNTQYAEFFKWYIRKNLKELIDNPLLTTAEWDGNSRTNNRVTPDKIKDYNDIIANLNNAMVTQWSKYDENTFFDVSMLYNDSNSKYMDIRSLDDEGFSTLYRITMVYDHKNNLREIRVKGKSTNPKRSNEFTNLFKNLSSREGFTENKDGTVLKIKAATSSQQEEFYKHVLDPIIEGVTRNIPLHKEGKPDGTTNDFKVGYERHTKKYNDQTKRLEPTGGLFIEEMSEQIKKYNELHGTNISSEFEDEQDFYIKTEALVTGLNPVTDKNGKSILVNKPDKFSIYVTLNETVEPITNNPDNTIEETVNEEIVTKEIEKENGNNLLIERIIKANETLKNIIKETENEKEDWVTVLERKGLFTQELLYNLGIINREITENELKEIKKLFREAYKGKDIKLLFKDFKSYALSELKKLYKKAHENIFIQEHLRNLGVTNKDITESQLKEIKKLFEEVYEGKKKRDFQSIFERTNGYFIENNKQVVIHDNKMSKTKSPVGRTLIHETIHAVFTQRLKSGRISNYSIARLNENVKILSEALKSKTGIIHLKGRNGIIGAVSLNLLNNTERETLGKYLNLIENAEKPHEELIAYALENVDFANILNRIAFYDTRNKTKQTWWNRIITAILSAIGITVNKNSALRAMIDVIASPHSSSLMGVSDIQNVEIINQQIEEEFKDNPKAELEVTEEVNKDETINNENITNENVDKTINEIEKQDEFGNQNQNKTQNQKKKSGKKSNTSNKNSTFVNSESDIVRVIENKRLTLDYKTFRDIVDRVKGITLSELKNNPKLINNKLYSMLGVLYNNEIESINNFLLNSEHTVNNKSYSKYSKERQINYIIKKYGKFFGLDILQDAIYNNVEIDENTSFSFNDELFPQQVKELKELVYDNNPQLQKLGTFDDYKNHLRNIFIGSIYSQLFYHASNTENIDRFNTDYTGSEHDFGFRGLATYLSFNDNAKVYGKHMYLVLSNLPDSKRVIKEDYDSDTYTNNAQFIHMLFNRDISDINLDNLRNKIADIAKLVLSDRFDKALSSTYTEDIDKTIEEERLEMESPEYNGNYRYTRTNKLEAFRDNIISQIEKYTDINKKIEKLLELNIEQYRIDKIIKDIGLSVISNRINTDNAIGAINELSNDLFESIKKELSKNLEKVKVNSEKVTSKDVISNIITREIYKSIFYNTFENRNSIPNEINIFDNSAEISNEEFIKRISNFIDYIRTEHKVFGFSNNEEFQEYMKNFNATTDAISMNENYQFDNKRIDHELVVGNPNDLLILGSSEDITLFEEYINNKNNTNSTASPRLDKYKEKLVANAYENFHNEGVSFSFNPEQFPEQLKDISEFVYSKFTAEIKELGTFEDYIDYLKTVFPNSILQQVFYHDSPTANIDKFRITDYKYNKIWWYGKAVYLSEKDEHGYFVGIGKPFNKYLVLTNITDTNRIAHTDASNPKSRLVGYFFNNDIEDTSIISFDKLRKEIVSSIEKHIATTIRSTIINNTPYLTDKDIETIGNIENINDIFNKLFIKKYINFNNSTIQDIVDDFIDNYKRSIDRHFDIENVIVNSLKDTVEYKSEVERTLIYNLHLEIKENMKQIIDLYKLENIKTIEDLNMFVSNVVNYFQNEYKPFGFANNEELAQYVEDFNKDKDANIITNTPDDAGDEYAIADPNNTLILGSSEDIKGFRKYMETKNNKVVSIADELKSFKENFRDDDYNEIC